MSESSGTPELVPDMTAEFDVLSPRLKREIDSAFDNTLIRAAHAARQREQRRARKRRRLDTEGSEGRQASSSTPGGSAAGGSGLAPGGFIVDDVPAAGGFIVDDDEEGGRTSQSSADEDSRDPPAYTHMPLRLIPAAMRVLRMSRPDDPDNLNMFRRAAMGYKKLSVPDSELQVSRSDFRAIVAGMLDPDQDARRDANGVVRRAYSPWAENSDELLGVVNYSDIDFGAALSSDEDSDDEDSDDGDSEDEYEVSDEAMSEDDSDDEYQAGGSTRAPGKGKSTARTSARRSGRKRRRDESSDSAPYLDTEDEGPKRITLRQQEECRRTWALFFPDVPDDHLDIQRIMIKDISRVADLLKEKITTEQIIEMLDAFSTSPDKSMSLSDFEQMMVAAKLA